METTFSPVIGIRGSIDVPVAVGGKVSILTGVEEGVDSLGRIVPTGAGDVPVNAAQADMSKSTIRLQARIGLKGIFIGISGLEALITRAHRIAVPAVRLPPVG